VKVPSISSILLSCLIAVGGFSVNLIHEDANRMIHAIDKLSEDQKSDHTQIGVNSANIKNLQDSDSRQWDAISKNYGR
jgi:hypothetical protein